MTIKLVRLFIYLLALAGVAEMLFLEARLLDSEEAFSEHGIVEALQVSMVAVVVLLLGLQAWRRPTRRTLSTVMALLFACLMIRETDQFLERYLFDKGWQTLVTPVFLTLLWVAWRQREALFRQLETYLETLSAGIMLAGMGVLVVFSRLYGRTDFWQAVMGDNYMRVAKNVSEEGIEFLGMTLILLAVIEWLVSSKRPAGAAKGSAHPHLE